MFRATIYAVAFLATMRISAFVADEPGLVAGTQVASAASEGKSPQELLDEEIRIAKAALKEMQAQVTVTSPTVTAWSHRLVEALRKRNSDKQGIIDALEQQVALMNANLEKVNRLFENKRATQLDVLDARYGLVEAKLFLAEAAAK